MSNESIEPPSTSDNSLNSRINYTDNAKTWVTFVGGCLKQEKVAITQKQVVNIYTVYGINLWLYTVGQDFALEISYLELLSCLKILILVNRTILNIVLISTPGDVFRYLIVVDW